MGSVTKYVNAEGKDTWRVDFRIKGRRVRESCSSKAAAFAILNEARRLQTMAKLGLVESSIAPRHDLKAAIKKYYEEVTKRKFNRGTHTNERTFFAKFYDYMANTAGVDCLEQIDGAILSAFVSELRKGVSPSTVNRQLNIMKPFLNKCVEWGYLVYSPARFIKKLREVTPTRRLWTKEEIQILLRNGSPSLVDIYAVLANDGPRPVELCGLVWTLVDTCLKEVQLHSWKNKGSGYRAKPLSRASFEIIERRWDGGRARKISEYVFTKEDGSKITGDYLCKGFAKDRTRIGLSPELGLYALRHTFATNLVRRGAPNHTVQKLLGHSQGKTTEKYVQVGMPEMKELISKFE